MKVRFFTAIAAFLLLAALLISCGNRVSCGNSFGAVGKDMHRHLVEDDTHEIRHCHKDGDQPHRHNWRIN